MPWSTWRTNPKAALKAVEQYRAEGHQVEVVLCDLPEKSSYGSWEIGVDQNWGFSQEERLRELVWGIR